MLDHPIIDVSLGLIFFYVVLSLVASAVQEWIASLLALRSTNLQSGVKNLIGDAYAKKVYEHPLINNLAKKNKLPSYIAPETLSAVLLEVIAKEQNTKSYVAHTVAESRALLDKIAAEHPLKDILGPLIDGGEHAANTLKDRLADWFDEGMTRVSGWYKRRAKWIILTIAFGVALATNASSIHMAEELWRNDALRAQIAAQAEIAASEVDIPALKGKLKNVEGNLQGLETFPIGWSGLPEGWLDWVKTVIGWLITAAAVSLGAPFWFDLLGKIANLRGSGGKAQAKRAS